MSKVKFGDVITRANTIEDKDNTERLYYVGGEHFDSGSLFLSRRGIIEGSTIGPMFYFGFKAGQVLIVSRNPHLKKASIVDFDGICSEKTFVIETKDESILLQKYIPFIVQSDDFWQYAEDHKSGSVNFFVNWSTFANYEFELPDINEQRAKVELLYTAEEERCSLLKAINATEQLKASFIDNLASGKMKITKDNGEEYQHWNEKELREICKFSKGKGLKKDCLSEDGENACILYGELFLKYGPVIENVISSTNESTEKMVLSKAGYILMPGSDVTPTGLATASCIMKPNVILGGDIIILEVNEEVYPPFLSYMINHFKEKVIERITGTTVKHITAKGIEDLKYPIPQEIDEQKKIADILGVYDEQINALMNKVTVIERLEKAIVEDREVNNGNI